MAMALANGKAEINMTPMIDVLLVLIIIFMVITLSLRQDCEHWFHNLLHRDGMIGLSAGISC
jgi:hypothetical protein